jgi:hypothetical protein
MPFSRKHFLVMVGVASVASAAEPPASARAQTTVPQISNDAARAFALEMRRFDSSLTNAQLREIAKNIDDLWKAGRRLHSGLVNGDPPAPWFETGE